MIAVCRSQFGKLGQMIASHQRLKELSRFLFIPGPDDVGMLIRSLQVFLKSFLHKHCISKRNRFCFTQDLQQFYLDALCRTT